MIAITPWRRTLHTWVHPADDLYTINPDYLEGVNAAGGRAAMVGHALDVDDAKRTLEHFSGLLLSGGDDVDPSLYDKDLAGAIDPSISSDRSDLSYLAAARSLGLPILGVCKGLQIINVAGGGTLHQHTWSDDGNHPPRPDDSIESADAFLANRHRVTLADGSLIAKVIGKPSITTNSLHHQAADRIGRDLVVTGRADDGTVEVLEHSDGRMLSVQWHPERMAGDGLALFRWLVQAAQT